MRKKLHAWLFCMLMIVSLLPVSINAEDQSESTFNLGEFDKTTNTYKDAVGTGSKEYLGLSIGFSLDIVGGESIDLPTVSGFEYMSGLSSHKLKRRIIFLLTKCKRFSKMYIDKDE